MLVGLGDDLARLGERHRQRFLDEHMFAGADGGEALRVVQVRRGNDNHRVGFHLGQRVLQSRETLRLADLQPVCLCGNRVYFIEKREQDIIIFIRHLLDSTRGFQCLRRILRL